MIDFIPQGLNELIKSDSKDIRILQVFYFK